MNTATRLDELQVTMIRQFVSAAAADVINLGLGQTNEPVPACITARLSGAGLAESAAYGPNAGQPALREAIARRYGVPAARVLVTAGVQESIFLTMMAMVEPGDVVAVPNPGFPVYATIARMFGAEVVEYELQQADGFRPTVEGIADVVDRGAKLICLCSPGNPTGAAATAVEWRGIGALLREREIVTFSDEIYARLQFDRDRAHGTLLEHHPTALCASGLAKTHGIAGWRLGWLIVPEEISGRFVALHQHIMTSASRLVQEAALGAFGAEGDRAVEDLNVVLRRKRDLARESLSGAGWTVDGGDGAFYLWVRHPTRDDGYALARALRDEAGVLTIPGVAFGSAGKSHLRVSYSVPEATLREGLARMNAAV